MSDHVIPATVGDDFIGLVQKHLGRSLPAAPRQPDGTFSLTFDPDLTAPEQAILDRLTGVSQSAIQITPAEWEGLEADIDGLRQYHGLATPTAAQTALATKAIIRVLRALLRD